MQRIRDLLKSDRPAKWIFEGDSITHGALHTFGYRDYTELFTERLRYELGRVGDIVIKSAVSGHTTRELLNNFEWRVQQFQPNVVFLMFGMNDCSASRSMTRTEFDSNLRTICRKIIALPSALPVLQTTCPILATPESDRIANLDPFMDTIRQVAQDLKLPLIDHTRHWKEIAVKEPSRPWYWMSDTIHPNNFGHQVFAELLFQELGIFDPKAPCCKFFHP